MAVMERSDILVASVLNVCKLRDAWLESGTPRISNDFVEAMDELTGVFDDGDIPAECRVLFNEYPKVREEWRQFGEYASERNPSPRQAFFSALATMEQYLIEHDDEWEAPPLESLKDLSEQKVSYRQMCYIYSHKGKGPFMRKGVPQPHLVKREMDKPGTVLCGEWLGPDGKFQHPATRERLAASQRVEKRLVQRAAKLLHGDATGQLGGLGEGTDDTPDFVPPTAGQLDAAESGTPMPEPAAGAAAFTPEELTVEQEQDATHSVIQRGEDAKIAADIHRLRKLNPNVSNRDISDTLNISIAEIKRVLAGKPAPANA